MLETIRKSTKSTYILLLFGAIILVFIFWGIGPGGGGKSTNAVAMVNGEPISIRDYLALHKRLADYYRSVLKERYTPEVAKELNLKKNAVAMLIDRQLAVDAAADMGISVSKAEVQEAIASVEAFQKDGVFDRETYFRALKSERMKPADYEADVKRDLLVDKVRAEIIKDVKVTDDDIKKAYLKEHRKINLQYVAISASNKEKGIKVTDEEARKYLMDHSTDFVIPAKVKAVYAYADYGAFTRLSKLTDKEIKEYYEEHKDRFTVPEKIQARHILIRPDMKAKDREAARKAAREKAEAVLKKVKGGANFATLARKYSGDPGSAKKGGDLGWFPRGVMMKPFEDAAFALKTGEISGIVETPFGFHIIKVEGRKKAKVQPLAKARPAIVKILSRDTSKEKALKAIEELREEFTRTDDVKALRKAVAKVKGVSLKETALFDSKHFDEALASLQQIKDSLFLMNKGEVSQPVKTFRGVYLVKVVKRVEARIPEYEEVAKEVKATLRARKAERAARTEADEVLKALKDGKPFDEAAGKKGLKVEETGFFSMGDGFIPGMGVPVQSHPGLFDLDEKNPLYDKPVVSGVRYFVVRWKASKEPDLADLTPEIRETLATRLKSEKEDETINKWLTSLRKKAEIQVFEDRM
jgi:peptidyl-prolyl cis-trans isomerase D